MCSTLDNENHVAHFGTHSSASGLRLRSLEKTYLRVRRMRTHFGDRAFSAPVLGAGTVSILLFVLLTQWTHLKCNLKPTCSFIHSFIHYKHLYSASSSEATQ